MSLATEASKKSVSRPSLLSLTWNSLSGGKPKIARLFVGVLIYVAVVLFQGPLRVGIVLASIWLVLFLWSFAIQMARQAAIQLALGGLYDDALRKNRWFSWLPSYGRSLKCWVLLEAGRYSDLLEATKPRAFDRHGQPKLMSSQLYYCAMALLYQGQGEGAQELFEAAYRLTPEFAHIQVALADCLLEQNKDPELARSLLSHTLSRAKWPESIDRNLEHADLALRKGRWAWALARCALRDKALWQMWHASEGSEALIHRDQAWLLYFAGETRWALGDTGQALAAFEEASALHPHGQLMLKAQEKLSKLRASI
ncbi:MAG: tetratricopeptide repeat protein [Terracidiphilus sp.]|jgi:tetratricopeptide (TPR) repeat protein